MKATPEQIIAELHKLKARWIEESLAHTNHSMKSLDDEIKFYHYNRASIYRQCADDLHDLTQTLQ